MPRSDVVARPTLPAAADPHRRAGLWRHRTPPASGKVDTKALSAHIDDEG